MTKREQVAKKKAEDGSESGAHKLNAEQIKSVVGVESEDIMLSVLNQLSDSMWLGEKPDPETVVRRMGTAAEMLSSLKPRDMQEGLLCSQMIATHYQLMECNRRAMIPEQTFHGRDMALKHAEKLSSIYTRQMETLDKHRGKGQQKITVEHVNVHAGGQAIVGNVDHGSSSDAGRNRVPSSNSTNALPEPEQEAMAIIEPVKAAGAKAAKKK